MPTTLNNTIQPDISTCQPRLPGLEDPNPRPMIHHNLVDSKRRIVIRNKRGILDSCYGVSSSQRVLTTGVFLRKYDEVRDCLGDVLGLSNSQREVALRLLRLWVYYGKVYPKECQVTELPGCSKATYWRTVKLLEERGLVRRVNRYLIRPHAQISNLYLLHNLLILLARYLAEHGAQFKQKWILPFITMPGRQFWTIAWTARVTAYDTPPG